MTHRHLFTGIICGWALLGALASASAQPAGISYQQNSLPSLEDDLFPTWYETTPSTLPDNDQARDQWGRAMHAETIRDASGREVLYTFSLDDEGTLIHPPHPETGQQPYPAYLRVNVTPDDPNGGDYVPYRFPTGEYGFVLSTGEVQYIDIRPSPSALQSSPDSYLLVYDPSQGVPRYDPTSPALSRHNATFESQSGPIGANNDGRILPTFVNRFIAIAFRLAAPIIMGLLLYTGLQMIYANGNEETLKNAKEYFRYLVLGLGFMLLSYSIVRALYFLFANG